MKKIVSMFLLGLILLTFVGTALAAEPGNIVKPAVEKRVPRFEFLKEFQNEIHQINAVRIENLNLRAQIVEKHDQLLDLYAAARESGNKETLQAAREAKRGLEPINQEIKSLHEQLAAERQAFRQEIKNRNEEAAREHINKAIELAQKINELLQKKIELLNPIIDILS